MATKIRRCLYIGLGGTGMKSLLHTKKMFMETYGKIPPMIGFLGIDTDGGEYKRTIESKKGPISLSPSEQLAIKVEEPRDIYRVNKDDFSWIPEECLFAMDSMTHGAGQVRANGRFAFTVNRAEVENKIKQVLNDITGANISNDPQYELLANDVEIHVVFSLCGGTGCGTFINLAYLLKEIAPKCKTIGYGVLPDVFEAMSTVAMSKVKPNAYGAIQDLDLLMHMGLGNDSLQLKYINSQQEINSRPFNSFIFIDNKNENGDTYAHVDDLTEMISLALITSAGELSTAAASVSDNLEKNINAGSMDIENKKAWAAGLGVCEIIFRGDELADIYAHKAADRLIELLITSCVDSNAIANSWIDEVKIRENDGHDDVIDALLRSEPDYPLSDINDPENAQVEVDAYIASAVPRSESIDNIRKEKLEHTSKEFKKLLIKNINQECGVGAVEKIISNISTSIEIFLDEMRNELHDLEERLPGLESNLQIAVNDIREYGSKLKILQLKSKMQNMKDDVMQSAHELVVQKREIVRRKEAIQFYTSLKSNIYDANTKISNIKKMLLAISKKLQTELAMIQNRIGKASQTFQIDLAQSSVNSIMVDNSELIIAEFIKKVDYKNGIYNFDEKHQLDVEELFMKYAHALPTSKNWKKTTIDSIIDKMNDDELDRTLRKALNKSMPLFRYTHRGYTPDEKPADSYYIGVYDKANTRLSNGNLLRNMLPGNVNMDFANIGVKDRIIVYRQIGVVPAYAINPVKTYNVRYENQPRFFHIDNAIYQRMQREQYSLEPKATLDDSLELWVKGFIFGLIKNENNMYYYKDEENGDVLDDYWMPLSEYRDEAFDKFKQNKINIRKEFNDFIDNYQKNKGDDAIKQLAEDAKANYFDKYSLIKMTKDEIKRKGNEPIKKLITDELNFVNKEL